MYVYQNIITNIFFVVPKKSVKPVKNSSYASQSSTSSMNGALMVGGGFMLVMFGALVGRPLFRLLFKFVTGNTQSTYSFH